MAAILVKVPLLDEGLILDWKDRKVSLRQNSPEAKVEWNYLQSKGLHGKYGHLLNLDDCWFTDLVIAVAVRVGDKNYIISADGKKQLALEEKTELQNPLPKGAAY